LNQKQRDILFKISYFARACVRENLFLSLKGACSTGLTSLFRRALMLTALVVAPIFLGGPTVSAALTDVTGSSGGDPVVSNRVMVKNGFGTWVFYKDSDNEISVAFSNDGGQSFQAGTKVFSGAVTKGPPGIFYVASSSTVFVAAQTDSPAANSDTDTFEDNYGVYIAKAVLDSATSHGHGCD
jgi:hypothetical protein